MNHNKPLIILGGEDGNIFSIMSIARKTAEKSNWTKEQIDDMLCDIFKIDCDEAIETLKKYFIIEGNPKQFEVQFAEESEESEESEEMED